MTLLGRIAPYLAVLLLVGLALFGAYHFGGSVKDDQWQSRWNDRDTADARARASAETDARALEQQRQQSAEKVQRDATQKLEQARTDAAGANAAADGLRQRVQELLHATSNTRSNPGPAGSCTPGASPGDLLAVVLDKSVQRNRELAAIADTAQVRGLACEAAYDALKR
ncbi:DUF2514 domain-containing protein [Pseudomonas gingeri]